MRQEMEEPGGGDSSSSVKMGVSESIWKKELIQIMYNHKSL